MANKYSQFFNTQMSSFEAQTMLFSKGKGLSKSEKDELFAAYEAVLHSILERESKENKDYCTSV